MHVRSGRVKGVRMGVSRDIRRRKRRVWRLRGGIGVLCVGLGGVRGWSRGGEIREGYVLVVAIGW